MSYNDPNLNFYPHSDAWLQVQHNRGLTLMLQSDTSPPELQLTPMQ
jgi:hypothetical protein